VVSGRKAWLMEVSVNIEIPQTTVHGVTRKVLHLYMYKIHTSDLHVVLDAVKRRMTKLHTV
jgi:hypothetical protein